MFTLLRNRGRESAEQARLEAGSLFSIASILECKALTFFSNMFIMASCFDMRSSNGLTAACT